MSTARYANVKVYILTKVINVYVKVFMLSKVRVVSMLKLIFCLQSSQC